MLTPEAGEDREGVLQHDEHDVAREGGKRDEDAVDVQPLEDAVPVHVDEEGKNVGGHSTYMDELIKSCRAATAKARLRQQQEEALSNEER